MDQIDPKVKALVSAIGEAETGPSSPQAYETRGKSGEFGRYQFMPDTYKAYAKKYLGDENAAPSVENQNKIAYSFVKEKKDAGFNPAQIASMWNAGEAKPNAYRENYRGVNSQGVEYDTPAYVQKVSQYYQQKSQPGVQTSYNPSPYSAGAVPGFANFSGIKQDEKEAVDTSTLGGQLTKRGNDIAGALTQTGQGIGELSKGDIFGAAKDVGSGILQTAGGLAGGVGDVIGAGLGLIPGVKQAEEVVGKGIGALAQTEPGQAIVRGAQDFATKHPTAAKDIEAVVNIAGLAGGGIGGKVVKEAATEGLTQAARQGILGGVVKAGAEKSALKEAEKMLESNVTKGQVKSAVRSGRVKTEGGVPGIVADQAKQDSVNEVAQAIMEGKIPKGTVTDKAGAIKKAADDMAIDLEEKLGSMEITPIVHQDEIDGLLESALKKIGEDPTMVGNAGESATRILVKFKSFLPQGTDVTALDILKARKKLDSWISGLSGGGSVFDPTYENAKTIALRSIRQGANDLIAEKAPDVAVKELLKRQSNLYRALDYIVPNVKKDIGSTPLSRFSARHPKVVGAGKEALKYGLIGTGLGAATRFLGE